MAGPLNGLGTGAQVPLANTFQPGQNTVRPDDNNKQQDNTVQSRGSAAAGTQNSETGNQDAVRAKPQPVAQNDNGSDDKASQKRGSLVDISV